MRHLECRVLRRRQRGNTVDWPEGRSLFRVLPESGWQLEREEPDAIRAWAEVALTALKRLTLPGGLRNGRPKRLRSLLFNTVGKVVAHARWTLLRLTGVVQHALLVRARQYRPARPGLAGD